MIHISLLLALQVAVEPAGGPLTTPMDELNAAFTPDGQTVYFTRKADDGTGSIMVTHREGERWGVPVLASFSGTWPDYDPFVTADGTRIFWMSKRPVNGVDRADFDLWMAEQVGDGWGEPKRLPEPINSGAGEYFPSVSRNGNLYFASNRDGGQGRGDIYVSIPVNGEYRSLTNLGPVINSTGFDGDPLIAPDESFLVFTGWGRPGGDPEGDLYIARRTGHDWSAPVALPREINSAAQEYAPALSPDGRWFYFASYRAGKANGDVFRVARESIRR